MVAVRCPLAVSSLRMSLQISCKPQGLVQPFLLFTASWLGMAGPYCVVTPLLSGASLRCGS